MAYLTVTLTEVKEREEGQGLVEYALILVLVSIISILALTTLGTTISGVFDTITGQL
ncbi:MAG: Flp family type IVb pilin [Chloroflexota bacterium]|nr:Flp family type IVb pilin [Chloroflexota bacterium]